MRGRRVLAVVAAMVGGLALSGGGVHTTVASVTDPEPSTEPLDYTDPGLWLCWPGADDVCAGNLDSTVVFADGTTEVVPLAADPDAPIDCFYVYPTVSFDASMNSDTKPGPEERFVVTEQVAPFVDGCRVFSPVYRQVTLSGLASLFASPDIPDGDAHPFRLAYADVIAAWDHYLDTENNGRGVVLIGHSQGAGILRQLLAEKFDDDSSMSELLVSAILAGSGVQVAPGSDRGGDFDNLPLCRDAGQTGCVVTWVTYRNAVPPSENALFGLDDADSGTVAACTNPAALAGGRVPLHPRLPADPDASILVGLGSGAVAPGAWGDGIEVSTPAVELPGIVTGGCVRWDAKSWLEVTPVSDAGPRVDDIPGDLTPEWGLHLVDISVVMGDLRELVGQQAAAWLAANEV